MLNFFKLASLPLGSLLLGACDHEAAAARKGQLQDVTACGGFAGLACPDGQLCVDDPKDGCDPERGGADCIGVCALAAERPRPDEPIVCGGIIGRLCPDDLICVDDPTDDCDPERGGADCLGICVDPPRPRGSKPDEPKAGDPKREHVNHDADKCAALRFTCPAGQVPFFDASGCGCEGAAKPSPT